MQGRSSMCMAVVSTVALCLFAAAEVPANTGSLAGLSEWDVTSFKVSLLEHQGANGDVQTDQNGWIHLGSNHLEGGDIIYRVRTGSLNRSDILEIWIDGFSTSNDLDVGPTVFIGSGKNRFEQITRMSGDAWRPFVFRFADDMVYGDVTDPSNRNESWRIRYPSSKYEVRRIDKAPCDLLEQQTLPVRISMTGAEDFVIKRIEVVVFRAGGGFSRETLYITNLAPYRVSRGDRVTVRLNQPLPERDADFYLVDTTGREHRISPHVLSSTPDNVWFYADGEVFSRSGEYQIKVVDRSNGNQPQTDSERFEYIHPRVAVKPKPTPVPKSPVDACTPPCGQVLLPPIPAAPPSYIVPVVPAGPFTGPQVVAGPPLVPPGTMVAPPVTVGQPMAPSMTAVAPMPQAGYTIQIGAYQTQTSAVAMVNKLRGYGFDAYISEATQGRARLYRVRVGRYPNKHLAYQDASRLKQSGFDTWITTMS